VYIFESLFVALNLHSFIKMSETIESRKICDLKVPELRSELEKRDLDKSGVKAILLERLQKVSVLNCI